MPSAHVVLDRLCELGAEVSAEHYEAILRELDRYLWLAFDEGVECSGLSLIEGGALDATGQ